MVHKINIIGTNAKTRLKDRPMNIHYGPLNKNYKILVKIKLQKITGHHSSCTLQFSPLPIIEKGLGKKGCSTKIHKIHLTPSDIFVLWK